MANVIMPKMGDGMEEGTLLRWFKQVGDQIEVGDPIAEIETDKVSIEIESTEEGVLTKTLVAEGQAVPIGTSIAVVGDEGEAARPRLRPPRPRRRPSNQRPKRPGRNRWQPRLNRPARKQRRSRRLRQRQPAQPAAATNGASGAGAAPAREPGDRLRASPIVKRLAEEHGLDLSAIVGTGPGGRIVKDDVMPFVTGAKPAPQAAPQATTPPAQAPAAPQPLRRVRPQHQAGPCAR